MFSTAVLMAAIVIVAKALGLLRDILVANAYGMQSAAQAYEIASRLPIMIFDFVIGGVVSAAFIPIFSELLVKRSEKDAMRFANSYVNLIFVLTATMALLGILFSDSLVRFLAPEASSEVLSLASYLSKIMFPMIVFTGLAFSFVGILQSLGEFRIPALISLVSNSIMVAYLFFLNSFFGIVGLAVAMLLGWASQALVQVPKLRSLGYRYSPVFDFASPEIKRSLKSALPILIGTWTQPICSLINTRYASGLDNAGELCEEAVFGVYADEVDIPLGECRFDLIALVFAHQTVVDKYARELIANCLCHERRSNRGVHAAREREQRLAGADLFTDRSDGILPVVCHGPVAVCLADAI